MNSINYILKVSENLVDKSAEMAENDPNGVIITVVSVSVVFAALILLYCAYTLIGKAVNSKIAQAPADSKDKGSTAEEDIQAFDDVNHDKESYMITIQRGSTRITSSAPKIQQSTETESSGPSSAAADRSATKGKNVTAPLPGVILSIKVNSGDAIKAGQTVAILEAMKMENEIQAEHDGIVQSVNVEKGDSVLEGTIIVTIS